MDEPRFRLSPDTVLRTTADGWVATNPRAHTHVHLDADGIAALGALGTGAPAAAWTNQLDRCHGCDRTGFDFRYGLWSDPSQLAAAKAPVSGGALFRLLHQRWIICTEDGGDYRSFLEPLASILDQKHLGTFHQLIGQHVGIVLRVRDEWRWWHNSKFTPDGLTLRPGPYKWIQETFFDRYFAKADLKGQHILDFACGNGYYARKFAALGAAVVGVDTAGELIALAERNSRGGCEFLNPRDPRDALDALRALPARHFDRVYMSDILLLLLQPGTEATYAEDVLNALARLLKPNGMLHLFEPNPVFWLACRIGDESDPSVVITEYRDHLYTVAPTLDRVMGVMSGAGLVLSEFLHPGGEHVPAEEAALASFARSFPLWDFLTFVPRP